MRCSKVESLMSQYVDGELSNAVEEKMRGHLCECADCAGGLEALREMLGLLESERHMAPPDLWPRIERAASEQTEKAQQESEQVVPIGRFDAGLAYGAVAAAICMIGLSIGALAGTEETGHHHNTDELLLARSALTLEGKLAADDLPRLYPEIERLFDSPHSGDEP